MQTVGIVATVAAAAAVVALAASLVVSLPDIGRYLRMRKM